MAQAEDLRRLTSEEIKESLIDRTAVRELHVVPVFQGIPHLDIIDDLRTQEGISSFER